MNAINYSDLRKNLKSVMDQIITDHEPVIITRRNGDNVVIVSYEDYAAIEETAYLLKSPKNAKRLRESIQSFEEGKGKEQKLIED
ncbi:MAG: type II toxin-antitoxin system prevent-host-death family antitoxin [Spirochaetales bacterium]|nr:type II toxin-antitoxin system prevent-host-death family antitoxin [Spirochaetales bacterium]